MNYQQLALNTFASTGTTSKDILHCKAGVMGEYGEVIDCYKKKIFTPNRFKNNIAEEWADGLWYIAVWHELKGLQLQIPPEIHNIDFGNECDLLEYLLLRSEELGRYVHRGHLADVTRFWFILASCTGVNVHQALEENIAKLAQRKRDGAYDII